MNIRKRFFTFLMAFAMFVSCMTTASAVEVKETTNNTVEVAVPTDTDTFRTVCNSNGAVSGTCDYLSCTIWANKDVGIIVASTSEVLVRFYSRIIDNSTFVSGYRVP